LIARALPTGGAVGDVRDRPAARPPVGSVPKRDGPSALAAAADQFKRDAWRIDILGLLD
jgi:hypothetical protein